MNFHQSSPKPPSVWSTNRANKAWPRCVAALGLLLAMRRGEYVEDGLLDSLLVTDVSALLGSKVRAARPRLDQFGQHIALDLQKPRLDETAVSTIFVDRAVFLVAQLFSLLGGGLVLNSSNRKDEPYEDQHFYARLTAIGNLTLIRLASGASADQEATEAPDFHDVRRGALELRMARRPALSRETAMGEAVKRMAAAKNTALDPALMIDPEHFEWALRSCLMLIDDVPLGFYLPNYPMKRNG